MVVDVFTGFNTEEMAAYFAVRVERNSEFIFMTKYENCGVEDALRIAQAMIDVMDHKKVTGFRMRAGVRVNHSKPAQLIFCAPAPFEDEIRRRLAQRWLSLPYTTLRPTPVAPHHAGEH